MKYEEAETSVPATIQICYMIGWKPDDSQPKALARGSATRSLKELGHHHPLGMSKIADNKL